MRIGTRSLFIGVGAAALLGGFPAAAQDEAIHLICVGAASRDEAIGTIGTLLSGESNVQRVGMEDSVRFTINADDTGSALLPKRLQSSYKEAEDDGSFPLLKVARGEDEITGQIRLHGMYKPRFRLDRLTGVVTVNGSVADFSGRCEPYDPETVQRKF